jgi:hypothetical protein
VAWNIWLQRCVVFWRASYTLRAHCIFNLWIKKIGQSFTQSNVTMYNRYTHRSFSGQTVQTVYVYIHTWATRHCQHCSEWVHHCPSFNADWVFLYTTWFGTLDCFPRSCLACLFLDWLAQILLLIKVPNLNTYKSHRYTSQLKQKEAQHRNFFYNVFQPTREHPPSPLRWDKGS